MLDTKALPKIHPYYGGELTYYKDLEVGTTFYVTNGRWYGKVIEEDGIKKVLVRETNSSFEIKDNDYNWLLT